MTGSPPTPTDRPPRGPIETWVELRPSWVLPVTVGGVSLALRAWTLTGQLAHNPFFSNPPADDAVYLRLATSLAQGAPPEPWFLAPLYPWLLSQVGRFATIDMTTACWLAVLIGVAASVAIALVSRNVHSRSAGWLAGLLHASAAPFVFSEIRPGQEPLLTLLGVLALWLTIRGSRRASAGTAAWAGVLGGIAMLGRATMVAWPLAAAWVLWREVRPRRSGVLCAAAALLGVLAALAPAAIRNAHLTESPSPFPWPAGVNLYLANGPDARRLCTFEAAALGNRPEVIPQRARSIAEEAEGRPLTWGEVSGWWTGRTWTELAGPGETAQHLLRKALHFWSVDELASNHHLALEARFSPWLAWTAGGGWWILALGLGGWWIARPRSRELDAAAIAVLLTWAALTLFFPIGRFRLPAFAVAVVCAGIGCAEILLGVPGRRRSVQALVLVLVAAAVAHAEPWLYGPRALQAQGELRLAEEYRLQGRSTEAVAGLRAYLREHPEDGIVRGLLARVHLDRNDPESAAAELELAARDPRAAVAAEVAWLRLLVLRGELDEAERRGAELAQRGRDHRPMQAEVLAHLARAASARGDVRLARERLERARRLAPDHPEVIRAAADLPTLP